MSPGCASSFTLLRSTPHRSEPLRAVVERGMTVSFGLEADIRANASSVRYFDAETAQADLVAKQAAVDIAAHARHRAAAPVGPQGRRRRRAAGRDPAGECAAPRQPCDGPARQVQGGAGLHARAGAGNATRAQAAGSAAHARARPLAHRLARDGAGAASLHCRGARRGRRGRGTRARGAVGEPADPERGRLVLRERTSRPEPASEPGGGARRDAERASFFPASPTPTSSRAPLRRSNRAKRTCVWRSCVSGAT